jgi:hypothetical protein
MKAVDKYAATKPPPRKGRGFLFPSPPLRSGAIVCSIESNRGTDNSYRQEENDCKYDYRYNEEPYNEENKARTAEFMQGAIQFT